jgi:hypothetical protein
MKNSASSVSDAFLKVWMARGGTTMSSPAEATTLPSGVSNLTVPAIGTPVSDRLDNLLGPNQAVVTISRTMCSKYTRRHGLSRLSSYALGTINVCTAILGSLAVFDPTRKRYRLFAWSLYRVAIVFSWGLLIRL